MPQSSQNESPNSSQGQFHFDEGSRYLRQGQYSRSLKHFQTACHHDATLDKATCLAAHVQDRMCYWADRERRLEHLRQLLEDQATGKRPIGLPPLCYLPLSLPEETFRFVAHLVAPPLARSFSHHTPNQHSGHLRVGYISADFRSHSAGVPLDGLLHAHNRHDFEIFGYWVPLPGTSAQGPPKCSTAFDHFVDLSGDTPEMAAEKIARDELHILVETTRHIQQSALSTLAFRPAPIQATGWGYGGTTGCSFVDFLICDRWMVPPSAERYFTENIAMIPAYHPIQPLRSHPFALSRSHVGLPDEGVVFAHFNATYKLYPTLFSAWMDVLRRVPNSVIWMAWGNAESRRNLRAEAEKLGVSSARLIFAEVVPHAEHVERLGLADCAFDNPHLGGGTTIFDCLLSTVPVVTLAGQSMSDRSGISIHNSLGLSSLVADSLTDYVDRCCELGSCAKLRADTRQRIREIWSSESHSVPTVTDIARGLEGVYHRLCSPA